MKYLQNDFLLHGQTSRELYHSYAANLPIIDYHCHLVVEDIAKDTAFENITRLWLSNDHYKWTALRSNGVPERLITGDATDKEKFKAWAETLPYLIGNPLHHWSHLELRKYFGFDGHLCGDNWEEVYDHCNKILHDGLSARTILNQSGVEMICSTDDPCDNLHWHKKIHDDNSFAVTVYPSFRPDRAINIEKEDFWEYIQKLSDCAQVDIKTPDDVLQALIKRLDYFCGHGCVVTDHGLSIIPFAPAKKEEITEIFDKRRDFKSLSILEQEKYKTYILTSLAEQYKKRDMILQLHYGVARDINLNLYSQLGVDAGGDAIGGYQCTTKLIDFLSFMDARHALPKTVIYSIAPTDNEAIDTVIGCFQTDEARGKIQHGSAWWVNDTKYGMENHMKSLASLGCLGSFIGMLTDSRSLLSYTRHDYFRRILCNYLGQLVDTGEYPNHQKYLKDIVEKICYENIKGYLSTKK